MKVSITLMMVQSTYLDFALRQCPADHCAILLLRRCLVIWAPRLHALEQYIKHVRILCRELAWFGANDCC